jgi:diguanylate cyclase (GGDEF)-like protein
MDRLQALVVDDDKEIAGLFGTVLRLVGFECEVVYSAKEALARLAAAVPDMILLDLRLGIEIGGEDILYQVRSNPRYDNTRVIVITAYPMNAEMVSDLADLVLLKPVDMEQLKALAARLASVESGPRRFAFRDPITQLFNQEFFNTRLDLAFERSRRRPDFLYTVIVFGFQIMGFNEEETESEISVGILREIGDRLREHLRPTDTVARLSGLKFAALLEELKQPEDLSIVLNRVQDKLAQPYKGEGETFQVTFKYGAAVHKRRYQQSQDILEDAERSLERALLQKE